MTMSATRFAPSWLTAGPITHRGLHDWTRGVVENSLGAFKAAADAGYTIECDLQISRDGEAVLFHDDTLDRVMMETGQVKDFTLAELQRMTFRHSSEKIPALHELLSLVSGRVPLIIELKPQWDGETALASRTIELLRDYQGHHCLMSFDPDVMAFVKSSTPSTIRGFVTDGAFDNSYDRLAPSLRRELRTLSCLERVEPHFLSVDTDMLPWAPVTRLRQCGMPVITWTIRSMEQAARARRYSDQITFEGFYA
jgi:glycerophosphoryl diester phosphodiesterase